MRHAFALMLLLASSATSCALILGDDFRVEDDDGDGDGDGSSDPDPSSGSGTQSGCGAQACPDCVECATAQDCSGAYAACDSDYYCEGMLLCMAGHDPCVDDCSFSCTSPTDCTTCYGTQPAFDAFLGCLQDACPNC
jgi:hypothetical protein